MTETIITFLPLLAAMVVFSVLPKYTFAWTLSTLGAGLVAHVVLAIVLDIPWWYAPVQALVAAFVWVLLLGFFGQKISGETLGIIGALIVLYPINAGILPALLIFVVGSVYTVWSASHKWRKYMREISNETVNLSDLIVQAGVDTGVMTQSIPNSQNVPDRREVPLSVRASAAPGFLLGSALALGLALLIN